MLTTSTASSRSRSALTDSSSLSATVDLEIVERIFERGRSATSFPQIFRPYTDVLQEHDISPTGDSAYYNFLLKVGVIKAPTWGDKWSIWKATNSAFAKPGHSPAPSSSPRSPPLARPVSTFSGSRSETRSYTHDSSSLVEVKSRVPFLASASSDLDEGFADESVYDEGRSEAYLPRPSPRKEMSRRDGHRRGHSHEHRSLVGYTPDQSIDGSNGDYLTSFIPPMRTSTPIFAQTPTYQKTQCGSAHPPAYSVSDISQTLEETTRDLSALGLRVPTPRGEGTQTPTWVDRIDDVPESERRAMEDKADDFYALGLMGRCWDMWFKTSEFYRVTYKTIPIARNNLLLRQTLEKWSKATQYQLTLPNTADKHREHHLRSAILAKWMERLKERRLAAVEARWAEERRVTEMRELWIGWKGKAEKRRTDRWKVDMAQREMRFTEKKQERLLSGALTYWRVETRSKLAVSDDHLRLVGGAFDQWHFLTEKKRHLRSILADLQKKRLAEAFRTWQRSVVLAPMERLLMEDHGNRLIRRVWDEWRVTSWQHRQSSTFDRRRLLLLALDKWKAAHRHVKVTERKAIIFDRTRIVDDAFKRWKLESWGMLLLQAREKRLRERVWGRWRERCARLDELDALADKCIVQSNHSRVHIMFSHWRSLVASHQTNHLRAHLIHEQNLRSAALAKWRTAAQTIKSHAVLADKAHAFFLLRTAFGAWRVEGAKRKAERWVEARHKAELRDAFERWRCLTAKYKALAQRETVLRDYSDKRVVKRLLDRWTERVVEVKDRELRIAKARDAHIMSNVLLKWRERLSVVQANEKKANDTLEIRECETLRRVFRFWRGRAKREKRLRVMADTSATEREGRLVQRAFERWYERKRERELEEIEREVSFLHENVILYGVMDRWKAATEILPGITADSARLKRRTVSIWNTALRRKQASNQIRRERDERLLAEAFGLWRDSTVHKMALSARRIRNRSRPSAGPGTAPTSTSTSHRRASFGGPTRHPSPIPRKITPTSTLSTLPNPNPNEIPPRNRARYTSTSTSRFSAGSDERRPETVYSEPVYSRLRSELAPLPPRGGSEEMEIADHRRPGGYASHGSLGLGLPAGGGGRGGEHIDRPRSGSEMLRALRGSMPGR